MKKSAYHQRILCVFTLIFLFFLQIYGQSTIVEGIVTDRFTGEALIGASIRYKNTSAGTVTDINGSFSIAADENAVLIISYVGYREREVPVESNFLNISLRPISHLLDEIVVIGYGTQKKSMLTAAISRVSDRDLENEDAVRLEDLLQGKISGMQIARSSGQPGADSKVRIRGIGTINDSNPLYIVDGMPLDGGVRFLNPSDIESIEVLKDAASAAVYGTRGANGVVLLTTKSGKNALNNAEISYKMSYGWQNVRKHQNVLNATEYMTLMNENYMNDGGKARFSASEIANAGKGTNWQKLLFNKNAPVQNHQLSVAGNRDMVSYFFSFGYINQEGIVGGNFGKSNFERYSVRANTMVKAYQNQERIFLNKLELGVKAGFSRTLSNSIENNSEYGTVVGSALTLTPLIPLYAENPEAVLVAHPHAVKDEDGKVFSIPPDGFQEIANPIAMLHAPIHNTFNDDKLVATFIGELDVLEGLKFNSTFGVDLYFTGNDGYEYPYFLAPQRKDIGKSSVYSSMYRSFTWQVENTLHYNKKNKNHSFSILLGQSAKKHTLKSLRGNDTGLLENIPDKSIIDFAIGNEKGSAGGTGGFSFEALASYFGRVSYNYKERYLFQFTLRHDGSSRFGPNNKWATFPSFSAGWNLTAEEFMFNRPNWFDYMKFRVSWGRNGNENIGNFRYLSLLYGFQDYHFGSGRHYGSSTSSLANRDIRWEQSEQFDFGMDAIFFKSLSFGFDIFYKKTIGMLMEQPIPSYVGQAAPIANAGSMMNRGVEFDATHAFSIGKFDFSIMGSAAYVRNKAVNLGNESGEQILAESMTAGTGSYIKAQNGQVFPFFYGFRTGGILQTQTEADAYNAKYGEMAQAGDVIFLDLAGAFDKNGNPIPDNKITDADKVMIGKGMPDWTFGLTFNAKWKNFDLNIFFQAQKGNDIFDFFQRGDIPLMNRPAWMMDRWHGEGSSNRIPRMTAQNPNRNWRSSELYIKDGSYLRLKNLQLAYTFPKEWMKKLTIQQLRLYLSADNLFTLTKYTGFDPEIASGDYVNIGVDKGIYPQAKTFSVGATVSF